MTTTTMNHSLHIGIGVYPHLRGNNLPGAVNDAQGWDRVMSTHLGASTVVLTDDSGTKAGIKKAIKALKDRMDDAGNGASGLVTFSGHGTGTERLGKGRIGRTQAICPSDVTLEDGVVHGAISLSQLVRWMGKQKANTTFIIDACYTVEGSTAMGEKPDLDGRLPDFQGSPSAAGRLVLGCLPWEQSYEIRVAGKVHGAFTHAMLTLFERWDVGTTSDGAFYLNASYGDLVFRARQLLRVLGLPQSPELLGYDRIALLPVLRPGYELRDGMTSQDPDGWKRGSQLSAGTGGDFRLYDLQVRGVNPQGDPMWLTMASVIVALHGHEYAGEKTFIENTEYWKLLDCPYAAVYDGNDHVNITGVRIMLVQVGTVWPTSMPSGWQAYTLSAPVGPPASDWHPATGAPSPQGPDCSDRFCGLDPDDPSMPAALGIKLVPTQSSTMARLEGVFWFNNLENPGPTSATPGLAWFSDLQVSSVGEMTNVSSGGLVQYYAFAPQ